ncbi:unnamed protein product [Echinostoma caproni]|uniref:PAPA-1 domain-containing protein n=1 Tax=Echinostoma caproni TaxID=27848 RepID=A0A183AS01_9TREM|nr:unnamed protein product [Echinostoma caproni]
MQKGFSIWKPKANELARPSLKGFGVKGPNRSANKHVSRKNTRVLEPKSSDPPLKRFVALATKPTANVNAKRKIPGETPKRSSMPRRVDSSREREIVGADSPPNNIQKSENLITDELPVTSTNQPDGMSVLEQVQRILSAKDSRSAGHIPEKNANPGTRVSKKGIYRSESRNKRPAQDPEPPAEEVCKRQRGISRADLQALVRKQRQARKSERLSRERAEQERRERIQRNLAVTAQAAAAAAKAPLPAPRKPLLLTDRSTGSAPDQLYPVSESNLANEFSSERRRKLDALLKNDDVVWSPRFLNGISTSHRPGHLQTFGSNWTTHSSLSVNHRTPDESNCRRQSPVRMETSEPAEQKPPGYSFPIGRDSFQQPVPLNNQPVGIAKRSKCP